jgi:hypothetical protein
MAGARYTALRGSKNSPETAGGVVFNDKNGCCYTFREEQVFFYADPADLKIARKLARMKIFFQNGILRSQEY